MTFGPKSRAKLSRSVDDALDQANQADLKPLFEAAVDAASKSYAKYSRFHVGVAVQLVSGAIFRGCNVENSSFPIGTCAERNALAAAVLGREDDKDLPESLAVVAFFKGAHAACSPCGACRQANVELNPACNVHFFYEEPPKLQTMTAEALLPWAFEL